MTTLGNREAAHAYNVEVEPSIGLIDEIGFRQQETEIKVHAENRDQAAAIAKRCGYEVRSVNMIG